MSIPAIGAISLGNVQQATPAVGATSSGSGAGGGFGAALTGAVNNLQQLQSTSDAANVKAVTGNLNDIQDATIAAARVQTTVQLMATLRNQAVDAFNTIMRMGG
ncbi:flagellar hook-basal body complex protein FliE [Microbacterium sp. X-17]|uniref:flagellar hook-basal body complex protein FliE n=1 Tax=Microbacterium sp. X-17 TaxID=3144404 RepID=UPI0031F519A9